MQGIFLIYVYTARNVRPLAYNLPRLFYTITQITHKQSSYFMENIFSYIYLYLRKLVIFDHLILTPTNTNKYLSMKQNKFYGSNKILYKI